MSAATSPSVTGRSTVTAEIAAAAARAGISPEDYAEVCWYVSRGCGNLAREAAHQAVRRADLALKEATA